MAYSSITKPSDYFNTKLYTGDNANNRQISLDFSPDFTWIKGRNAGYSHILFDRVRTNANYLVTNADQAEQDGSSSLGWTNTGCTTNSFTIDKGSNGSINNSGDTYVAWNWLAGSTGSTNYNGSINSTVSANTTAGFSIVSWTGSGADATIGHGLSSAPTIYIVKNRSDASDWRVGQVLTSSNNMTNGNGYYMELNDSKASTNPGSATTWGSTPTAPTSSVFTVGSNNAHNGSGDNMIAYCFHSVEGYSKMGSYTGNGNADGTFVYTGFKPAVIIAKLSSGVSDWRIYDNKRLGYNVDNNPLRINDNRAEETDDNIDFLSNGFKWRTNDSALNGSGSTYIYMAFASAPLVGTNNIPATAR